MLGHLKPLRLTSRWGVREEGGQRSSVTSQVIGLRYSVWPVHNVTGQSSSSGFSTDCRFPYFLSKSLNASIARAFRVVSASAARIRSDRQPSRFILISSPLKDPGSRDLSLAGLAGRDIGGAPGRSA